MTMALDDMWMISVDDHLIEPPNVWVDRLPTKFRDRGPRWVTDDQGEAWHIEDDTRVVVNGAVVSAAYSAADRPGPYQPMAWSEIPPSCYDPLARAEAMDVDHVLASLPFPNLPGFAGRVFQNLEDKELALLCIQAYNDWIIDEFAAAIPGRIIEVALIPMWDGKLAAQEAERAIGRGACSVSFSMAPHKVGFPPIHDEHWDPLFSVMSEAGLPISTHLGTGFETDPGLMVQKLHSKPKEGDDFGKAIGLGGQNGGRKRELHPAIGATVQLSGQECLIDWLTSGTFDRFPNLKVALSENGIGWIPSVLQEADVLVGYSRNRITSPTDAENNPILDEKARQKAKAAIDAREADAGLAAAERSLQRAHVRLLHLRPARPGADSPYWRRQRHDRDRLPALHQPVAALVGCGERVSPYARRRRADKSAPQQRRARIQVHAGGACSREAGNNA